MKGRKEGRKEGRAPSYPWLRLSARRLAVVNTFSLVSLQMNTAIEATYNINVPPTVSLARRAPPLASISLPPTLSRGSIQNGHINLIISSVIRLADEERLGTDVGYPYQEWCQCSLLCSLCYARLGPAPRRSSDGYRTLSSYSSPCLLGTPSWFVSQPVNPKTATTTSSSLSFSRSCFRRYVFRSINLSVNFQSVYPHLASEG